MGKKLKFRHVDVFAEKPFGGNQLAVFLDAKGLKKQQMQSIAREMNFSETTYVLPSKDRELHAHIRIFTPLKEVPFAGHPVIGTAYVLCEQMNKKRKNKVKELFLGVGSGRVRVGVEYQGGKKPYFTMFQPIPRFGVALQDRGQAASAVTLDKNDIVGGGVVSNGLSFLIVEVTSPDVVSNAKLNIDVTGRVIKRYGVSGIYLFSRYERGRFDVHSRFFAPTLGVYEDPATGSASGAVGAYLSRILKFPMELRIRIEQGVEISRPSEIDVYVRCDRGVISEVSVSGHVTPIAEGVIELQ